MEVNENTNLDTEESVDALLNTIESNESQKDSDATQEQQAPVNEYAIKYNGKEIKAPLEKILRWAEQGYDAPNRIGDLNKRIEEFSTKEKTLSEIESRYGNVDKYARENPQWWDFVQKQYEQNLLQQKPDDKISSFLSPIQQELAELKKSVQSFNEERTQKQIQEDDAKYLQELETIKKQYPKIDFTTQDQEGKSLEYKVLEHAQKNGIKKFTTAFRDFYYPELEKMISEEAKEKAVSSKQAKNKLGFLGIGQAQSSNFSNDDVKGKSYNDLEKEILRELNLV